ncbi:MAG: mannosyl-3-phosphoglycerate phosphatase [Candidatus Thermoplasmatota archaeon]|nr:mannosyl-3-phosphoglycerate phosphatase [Candidatus Thermoplasmatota archaeon]
MQPIIFTDLDGTLLDKETYSYEKVLDTISTLKKHKIPIIFCSHKTHAEQEVYRRKLAINDPFIVENGGAIFVPCNYFTFNFEYHKIVDDNFVIELGTSYKYIRAKLKKIEREIGIPIKGFGDMSIEEVARDSGLTFELAIYAKKREYDETLKLDGPQETIDRILKKIEECDLNWTHGGRYYSVMGENDKGRAVEILSELFKQKYGIIKTIGIGDSLSDLSMLEIADEPYLVQKPGNVWENIELQNLTRVEGVGPEGWNIVVKKLLSKLHK